MASKDFLKSFGSSDVSGRVTLTDLSLQRLGRFFEHRAFRDVRRYQLSPQAEDVRDGDAGAMLFLRLDQALELLEAAQTLRERLIVRYFLFNGLSPMELSNSRIEHLDPLSCTLFLPRRHWKRSCVADVDPETVRLQIIYSGDLRQGPLIRSVSGEHLAPMTLWDIVKSIALRTAIPGKEKICPLVLKRTFAREWILSGGNVCTLQKQFSHKHLWSTARYLRFVMEDVKPDHSRLMARARGEIEA